MSGLVAHHLSGLSCCLEVTDETDGMAMIWETALGDGKPNEKPVPEVCVDGFSMAKYTVTVGQFRKFVNATGYRNYD